MIVVDRDEYYNHVINTVRVLPGMPLADHDAVVDEVVEATIGFLRSKGIKTEPLLHRLPA